MCASADCINIMYCGDGNIADGVVMSVISLCEHTQRPLHIYLLSASVGNRAALNDQFAEHLQRTVRTHHPLGQVMLFDVSEIFASMPPTANMDTRFTPCCMLRLYADLIADIPERILYLDNDVICREEFERFYDQEFGTSELCGTLDHYGRWFFGHRGVRQSYINSGVLLLNMSAIRQSGLFGRCRRLCTKRKMFMPDQSALNKLASKRLCPRRFNEQRRLQQDTVFHHFSTHFRFWPRIKTVSVKPWDIQQVNSILGLHDYDRLYGQLQSWKTEEENYANT